MMVLKALLSLIALSLVIVAEDYRCGEDAGCTARCNDNGELDEVEFRKGDIVSTEDGWVVSTDDGWVKIPPNAKRALLPAMAFVWTGEEHIRLGFTTGAALGIHGGWRRELPRLICLI